MACDPGRCPTCEMPLMHTCEDLKAEAERQLELEAERIRIPLV
jgi:hypothetical protein